MVVIPSNAELTTYIDVMMHLEVFNLLSLQVRDILKQLWENEADILSYICGIQNEGLNTFGQIASHSMFFIEALLVSPIKFRPPTMGTDSVSIFT